MVNFLCQLHWVSDDQTAGKMSFLVVSVRESLGELSICICRLRKEVALTKAGENPPAPKATKRQNKKAKGGQVCSSA